MLTDKDTRAFAVFTGRFLHCARASHIRIRAWSWAAGQLASGAAAADGALARAVIARRPGPGRSSGSVRAINTYMGDGGTRSPASRWRPTLTLPLGHGARGAILSLTRRLHYS
eukprot:6997694-Prymnesium_polylepis.1